MNNIQQNNVPYRRGQHHDPNENQSPLGTNHTPLYGQRAQTSAGTHPHPQPRLQPRLQPQLPHRHPPPSAPQPRRPLEPFFISCTTLDQRQGCIDGFKHFTREVLVNPNILSVRYHRVRPCPGENCVIYHVPETGLFPDPFIIPLPLIHQQECGDRELGTRIRRFDCCSYGMVVKSKSFKDVPKIVGTFPRYHGPLPQPVYDDLAWRHGIYGSFVARQPFIGLTRFPVDGGGDCTRFSVLCPYLVSPFHCEGEYLNLRQKQKKKHKKKKTAMNDGHEGTPCLAIFTFDQENGEVEEFESDVLRKYFKHVDLYHGTGEYIAEESDEHTQPPKYYQKATTYPTVRMAHSGRLCDNPFIPLDIHQFIRTGIKLNSECLLGKLKEKLLVSYDEGLQSEMDKLIRKRCTQSDLIDPFWIKREPGQRPFFMVPVHGGLNYSILL